MYMNHYEAKKRDNIYYAIGIIIYTVIFVYFLALGDDIHVTFIDQLDCEMEYYMLRASAWPNVFQQTYPEFMSGHAMVQVASFITIFLYVIFSPIHAFVINYMAIRVFGFIGMMMLLRRTKIESEIAFFVAMTYSSLPLYSVYGLTSFGIPLLIACFMDLRGKKNLIRSHAGIILYGVSSSIVLVGYFVVPLVFIYILYLWITKKKAAFSHMIMGGIELLIAYILTNLDLLGNVLFQAGNLPKSHKSAYVITPVDEWQCFKSKILGSFQHTPADAIPIYILFLVVGIILIIYRFGAKKQLPEQIRSCLKTGMLCIALIVAGAAFAALYDGRIGYAIRNRYFAGSALYGFSADRILWTKPALLFIMFAQLLSIVLYFLKKWNKYVAYLTIICIIGLSSNKNIHDSDLFRNLLIKFGERSYSELTWHNFFAEDIYGQIRDYIGENQSDYYVASVGLHPQAALYNGFFCIDGYANTYDVEYKDYFYNIIEKELQREGEKDLYSYFTGWGNRCYIFSSEIGTEWWIPKSKQVPITLCINTEPMKSLGCRYLLASVPITNCEEIGLEYLEYFETEESVFGIYLYEIR